MAKPRKHGFLAHVLHCLYAAKHELRMLKDGEARSPGWLRFVIWSFVIISSFVIRISSFCSHVSDHVVAKLATLDFGRAIHQAREIVSDTLARDGTLQSFEDKISGFGPAHVTEHHLA